MAFSIPDDIFTIYHDAIDALMSSRVADSCTLVYPPLRTACINCIYSNWGSTNVYKTGGPMSFTFGNCPLCGGQGYKETETTEEISLRVYWRTPKWIKVGDNINYPEGTVQVIGYASDADKLIKANEVVLVNDKNNRKLRFALSGELYPHGFGKDKYFIAYLERV
jgi:hypothetical protein